MGMLIYFIIIILVPILASWKVRSAYKKYSKVHSSSNMTGADVARRILNDNGIYDVTVEPVGGTLSDHYDPRAKVIRLSEDNYYGTSVAGAAVAAHEVGHAIQDHESYAFLRLRHSLVPVANIGSNFSWILIFIGIIAGMSNLLLLGIVFMLAAVV